MGPGVYANNVVSFKYSTGVILAVDTSVSYGSIAIPNVQRVHKITDNCLISFSGLLSEINHLLSKVKKEIEIDYERKLDPQGVHKMVQRILYYARSEGRPINVSVIVSGVHKKENKIFESTDSMGRFIGAVNSKGNFWFDDSVSLSFSQHLVLPLLRDVDLKSATREEAISIMENCFRILCYKDTRASNRIQIGFVDEEGARIYEPALISTDWSIGLNDEEIVVK